MSKISCEQSSWFVFGLHVAWDHCPERTSDSTQDWKDGTNGPILRNPKVKLCRSTSRLLKKSICNEVWKSTNPKR
jgi:hypothetical protein